jgi:hypothetical protein
MVQLVENTISEKSSVLSATVVVELGKVPVSP